MVVQYYGFDPPEMTSSHDVPVYPNMEKLTRQNDDSPSVY